MRLEGWETRLAAVMDRARHRPYQHGVHDCFSLACGVVEALTGVDRYAPYAGTYASRREALAAIAAYGDTFEAAASKFFGGAPIPINIARRGDIAELPIDGLAHLAVVMGRTLYCAGEAGLVEYPRSMALRAWVVG